MEGQEPATQEVDELDINPDLSEAREGTAKLSLDEILGKKVESKREEAEISKESSEPKTDKEIFAEVKTAVIGINFLMTIGSGVVARMLGKKINISNIDASEQEINRLSKAAQPLYEKYFLNSATPEYIFIFAFLSIYGVRIFGEFYSADGENVEDLTERTSKGLQKPLDSLAQKEFWRGDKNYFQTGEKAGQLKPKRRK